MTGPSRAAEAAVRTSAGRVLLIAGGAWLVVLAVVWISTSRTVPLVSVRWSAGATGPQRQDAERAWSLVRYPTVRPDTASYFVLEADARSLRAIVTSPLVDDTAYVDRATFALDVPPRARYWAGDRVAVFGSRAGLLAASVSCGLGLVLLAWRRLHSWLVAHARDVLLMALVAASLGATWCRNDSLSHGTSFRYRTASTIARSQVVLGSPRDYTGWVAARGLPAEMSAVDLPFLRQEIEREPGYRDELMFEPFDEKGLIDFSRVAYQLFGISDRSLLRLFFFVIALGIAFYLTDHGSDGHAFLVLGVIAGLYVTTFILPVSDQLDNLNDPRLFAFMSVIPMFHVIASMVRGRLTRAAVGWVSLQTALMLFVSHARASTQWQVLCVLTVAAAIGGFELWSWRRAGGRDRGLRHRLATRVWPALVLIGGLVALSVYPRVAYHPAYFGQYLSSHVVWHSAVLGFAVHPEIAREFKLPVISDEVGLKAAQRRLIQRDDRDRWEVVFGGAYNIGGFEHVNWTAYDLVARDVVFDIVRRRPADVLATYIWYKPTLLMRQLWWAMGFTPTDVDSLFLHGHRLASEADRRASGLYFRPWRPEVLIVLALGLWLSFPGLVHAAGRLAAVSGLALLLSCLPSLFAYPVIHVMGDAFVLLVTTAFVGAGWLMIRTGLYLPSTGGDAR